MEDEGMSSGLGSLALYELGRGDERWHQQQANFVSSVAARLRGQVPVNVQALIADNQALRHENAVLRGNNQALKHDLKRCRACCEIAGVWVMDGWEKCGMRREAALCGSLHPFRGSFSGLFRAADRVPV